MPFTVHAHWDNEAKVWWAESEDIHGLVAEAESFDGLKADILAIVPELMRLNNQPTGHRIEVHLVAERVEDLSVSA
jgi:hypothetical protein